MRKNTYQFKVSLLILIATLFFFNESKGQLLNSWYNVKLSAANLDTFGSHNAVAFSINNKAYILTGDTGKPALNELKFTNQVWEYDFPLNTWTRKKDFPGKTRIGAIGFSIGQFGYVGLGLDSTYNLDNIFSITPEYEVIIVDSTGMPVDTIFYPADTIFRNTPIKIWDPKSLNDLWKYDPIIDTWYSVKHHPILEGLSQASVTVVNGSAYVFGGVDSLNTYYKEFHRYDTSTNDWTKLPDLPGAARIGAAMFNGIQTQDQNGFLNNPKKYIYVGTGLSEFSNTYFRDFYRFDSSANSWTKVADLPVQGFVKPTSYGFGRSGFVLTGFNGNYLKSHLEYDINSNTWIQLDDYIDSAKGFAHGYSIGPYLFINGGYGALNKVYASHLYWGADTTTVRILNNLPDTICGGDSVTLTFQATDSIRVGNKYFIEISDSSGVFAGNYQRLDSITNSGNLLTVKVKVPETTLEGANYKFRIIASNKSKIGQPTVDPLFVKQFASVVIPPLLDTICAGGTKIFSVLAAGTNYSSGSGLRYQWLFNGNPINDFSLSQNRRRIGTNSDTLRIDSVTLADAGNYSVRVIGDCNEVTSSNANLFVLNIPAPNVVSVPKDTLICESDSITFPVSATGINLNYAWFRNGQPLIPNQFTFGDSASTLIISNFQRSDSGWFKAKVYEDCGAFRFTDSFRVTFGEIVRVQDQTPRDSSIVERDNMEFKVQATGVNLKFQWFLGNTPLSDGPKYQGTQDSILKIFDASIGQIGFYRCLVTGDCGQPVYSPISLLEVDIRPTFVKQPSDSFKTCSGSEAVISIIAEGANLTYQWFKNGFPVQPAPHIVGINQREIIFNPVLPSDGGIYFCRVYNGTIDSAQSENSDLIILPTPPKPTITKISFNVLRADQSGADYYIWQINGSASSNDQQNITVTTPGDYRVRTVFQGCISEYSDPFTTTLSSSFGEVENLKVYPNPTSRMVTIEMPESIKLGSSVNIVMIDLLGKEVYNFSGESNYNHEINVQNLSKGVYLVRVVSGNQTYVTKLVKE